MKDRNIAFLLQVTGILSNFGNAWKKRYVEAEGLNGCQDIGFLKNGEEALDNDWGLDHGEEWILNDYQNVEEMVDSKVHVDCGMECPMVARVVLARKMEELEVDSNEEITNQDAEADARGM